MGVFGLFNNSNNNNDRNAEGKVQSISKEEPLDSKADIYSVKTVDEFVELFNKYGVQPKTKSGEKKDYDIFHDGSLRDNIELVDLIIEKGYNPFFSITSSKTTPNNPFCVLLAELNYDVIEYLTDKGLLNDKSEIRNAFEFVKIQDKGGSYNKDFGSLLKIIKFLYVNKLIDLSRDTKDDLVLFKPAFKNAKLSFYDIRVIAQVYSFASEEDKEIIRTKYFHAPFSSQITKENENKVADFLSRNELNLKELDKNHMEFVEKILNDFVSSDINNPICFTTKKPYVINYPFVFTNEYIYGNEDIYMEFGDECKFVLVENEVFAMDFFSNKKSHIKEIFHLKWAHEPMRKTTGIFIDSIHLYDKAERLYNYNTKNDAKITTLYYHSGSSATEHYLDTVNSIYLEGTVFETRSTIISENVFISKDVIYKTSNIDCYWWNVKDIYTDACGVGENKVVGFYQNKDKKGERYKVHYNCSLGEFCEIRNITISSNENKLDKEAKETHVSETLKEIINNDNGNHKLDNSGLDEDAKLLEELKLEFENTISLLENMVAKAEEAQGLRSNSDEEKNNINNQIKDNDKASMVEINSYGNESTIKYPVGKEPDRVKKRLDILFPKLDEAYPDKKITRFQTDHKKWAETVCEIRAILGYPDNRSFFEAYGYEYITKDMSPIDRNEAIKQMNLVIEKCKVNGPLSTLDEVFSIYKELSPFQNVYRMESEKLFGTSLAAYLKEVHVLRPRELKFSDDKVKNAIDRIVKKYEGSKRFSKVIEIGKKEEWFEEYINMAYKRSKDIYGKSFPDYLKEKNVISQTLIDDKKINKGLTDINYIYTSSSKTTVVRYLGNENEHVITNNVKKINSNAFAGSSIEKIYFEKGSKYSKVEKDAFAGIDHLTCIDFTNSEVTTIAEDMFPNIDRINLIGIDFIERKYPEVNVLQEYDGESVVKVYNKNRHAGWFLCSFPIKLKQIVLTSDGIVGIVTNIRHRYANDKIDISHKVKQIIDDPVHTLDPNNPYCSEEQLKLMNEFFERKPVVEKGYIALSLNGCFVYIENDDGEIYYASCRSRVEIYDEVEFISEDGIIRKGKIIEICVKKSEEHVQKGYGDFYEINNLVTRIKGFELYSENELSSIRDDYEMAKAENFKQNLRKEYEHYLRINEDESKRIIVVNDGYPFGYTDDDDLNKIINMARMRDADAIECLIDYYESNDRKKTYWLSKLADAERKEKIIEKEYKCFNVQTFLAGKEQIEIGDYITIGSIGEIELKWRIIDITENAYLILCDSIIDVNCMLFHYINEMNSTLVDYYFSENELGILLKDNISEQSDYFERWKSYYECEDIETAYEGYFNIISKEMFEKCKNYIKTKKEFWIFDKSSLIEKRDPDTNEVLLSFDHREPNPFVDCENNISYSAEENKGFRPIAWIRRNNEN